jgi:phage repressor protein C with HTH and peptisase S24 domain
MGKQRIPLSGVRKLIDDAITARGGDYKAASVAIGRGETYIQQYLRYGTPRELGERDRKRLAAFLQIDESNLLIEDNQPDISINKEMPRQPYPSKMEFNRFRSGLPEIGRKDLPIRGTATGGTKGGFLMVNDVVDYAYRPAALADAKNAYGILIRGSSMEPRWMPGEAAYVSPDKPYKAGDFVLVQLEPVEGEIEGLIKQLVKIDDNHVTLRQFNPEKTFRIARSDVKEIHRIYWPNELLGL